MGAFLSSFCSIIYNKIVECYYGILYFCKRKVCVCVCFAFCPRTSALPFSSVFPPFSINVMVSQLLLLNCCQKWSSSALWHDLSNEECEVERTGEKCSMFSLKQQQQQQKITNNNTNDKENNKGGFCKCDNAFSSKWVRME